MAKNINSLQLLRNSDVFTSKTQAVDSIKLGATQDGVLKLARYQEDGKVKTLFAINYVADSGTSNANYTIYSCDKETFDALEKKVADLIGSGSGSIADQIASAINGLKGNVTTEYDTLEKIEGKVKANATAITAEATNRASAITAAIDALDKADTAVDGEFVDSVSEENGIITVTRKAVAADKVTATAIASSTTTVAVEGTDVKAQIESLGKTIKTVEGNAAKYEVVKLTSDEVTTLGDANVKEAYKVVSYVGDEATATKTQVGETIKIYKDASLVSVVPTSSPEGENTSIEFTYTLADGTTTSVTVDLGKAIFESEMGNGIHLVNNKIAVELDSDNESAFLTVGENGLKLSGVQTAIDTKVESLDAEVASTDGSKVTVKVTEVNGKVTAVNVTETDIASNAALTALQNDVKSFSGDVATNTTNIAALRADADTISGNVGTLRTDVNAISGDVKTISGKAEANTTAISTANTNIAKKLETVKVNEKTLSTGNTAITLNGADVKLDGYAKGTSAAIAATDTINVALGKLEAKADSSVKSVTSGNTAIEIGGTATAPTVAVKVQANTADGIANPISVGTSGLTFTTVLDCGTY